jgi:glycerophosphoryl diester phosphodiesterase
VLAAIDAADVADRVMVQSFDHRSLGAMHSVRPEVRLSALTLIEPPDLLGFVAAGANIWSPNFNGMSADLVEEAHAAGMLVIPWTVNRRDDMVLVIERGADGFIITAPTLLSRYGEPLRAAVEHQLIDLDQSHLRIICLWLELLSRRCER